MSAAVAAGGGGLIGVVYVLISDFYMLAGMYTVCMCMRVLFNCILMVLRDVSFFMRRGGL